MEILGELAMIAMGPSLRGAKRRSNPAPRIKHWIASPALAMTVETKTAPEGAAFKFE
jgi:hypothetical protein